jgi:hypothetical protein
VKVVFYTTYPVEDASRRLRIDPLVSEFRRRGADVRVRTLMSSSMFRQKNDRGARRLAVLLSMAVRLFLRSVRVLGDRGDVCVVHREAFPFFTPAVESHLRKRFTLMVLDVDDAIYAQPTHGHDWRRWLRDPRGVNKFREIFDLFLCGGPRVAGFFDPLGDGRALVHPTCPPSSTVRIARRSERQILWTGSQSTLSSLQGVLDEVLEFCEQEGFVLRVLGGKNVDDLPPHPSLRVSRWTETEELEALSTASFGIMPLPNTEWEAGKSAYKALLYLTAGLPAVVSPVGLNGDLARQLPAVVAAEAKTDWSRALSEARELGDGAVEATTATVVGEFGTHQRRRAAVDRILRELAAKQ